MTVVSLSAHCLDRKDGRSSWKNHVCVPLLTDVFTTLKTNMWRYFMANNTCQYLNVSQGLVKSYNNSYHSSIKMAPMQVTSENTSQVNQHLYGPFLTRHQGWFKKSGLIRISKLRERNATPQCCSSSQAPLRAGWDYHYACDSLFVI